MAKQVLVTDEGLKKLEAELEELKSVKRKEIADKIKVALSFGDLSENSEYDEAKNEQADLSSDMVHVGSRVKVYDMEFEEEVLYQVVGSTESDPVQGKISDESPVGKALLGHKAGDIVEVETPSGSAKYEILELVR